VAIGLLAVLLKGAHAYQLTRASIGEGVSNARVRVFVFDALEPEANRLAIAPTLLWPYVDPVRSVVLIDPGARMWKAADPRWQSITTVILDRDLLARGWGAFARVQVQCGAFVKKGSLGRPSGGAFYLEAYKLQHPPCSPSSN
jgi:hypothetical protein